MARLTKTLLTKFEMGVPDRFNQLLNSYEKSIDLPTHQLSSQIETLARYLPMADEARGVLVAVAERLAMVQPVTPVPYLGEVFSVGWISDRNWSGLGIPKEVKEGLMIQTPNCSANFWGTVFEQIDRVLNSDVNVRAGQFCRLDIKEDFSDWRVLVDRNDDRITHCYSNGYFRNFVFQSNDPTFKMELVQFHFWQIHENVSSVFVDAKAKSVVYRFNPLDTPAHFDAPAEGGWKEAYANSLQDNFQQVHPLKLLEHFRKP